MGQAPRHTLLITGAGGVIGTILARNLRNEYDLIGTDLNPPINPNHWADWVTLDLANAKKLGVLFPRCHSVIHMATGAGGGWDGLKTVEIESTRTIISLSVKFNLPGRVILASTNHVAGGIEVDWMRSHSKPANRACDFQVRPDSEYGVAKAFVEAYGRYASEQLGVPVSCLRIGTVRPIDDPEVYVCSPDFRSIGCAKVVRNRLSNTWLTHHDMVRIVEEELASPDTFRLRYAYSGPDSWIWTKAVDTWSSSEQ